VEENDGECRCSGHEEEWAECFACREDSSSGGPVAGFDGGGGGRRFLFDSYHDDTDSVGLGWMRLDCGLWYLK